MTALQKVQLRLSEIRKRMAELAGLETLTEEQTQEVEQLRAEFGQCETRQQALLIAGDGEGTGSEETTEETPEEREYSELLAGASVGEIVAAAVEQRNTDGQTAELQQHHQLRANQIPLDLLIEPPEERTAGVTPAPANVGATQRPIIPAVFPMSHLSHLSIPQDRLMTGEAVYTVLSTSAAPGTPEKGAAQAHSEGAFAVKTLAPARIQASMFYAREDAARLAGLDAALRQNLNEALSDKLDEKVLDDLLTGSTLTQIDADAADTFETYLSRFAYERVDGRYAEDAMALRVTVGTDTYASMGSKYASGTAINALTALRLTTGGDAGRTVRVTPHAPAVASNKQAGLVRVGMRRDYAVGIWEGITIIVDEVTQAKEGEIILTAVMLYAQSLLRAAGFAKVEAQHA